MDGDLGDDLLKESRYLGGPCCLPICDSGKFFGVSRRLRTALVPHATGHSFWTYWAPYFLAAVALLLGIPVYLAQRRHMNRPEPVPPYR